MSAALFIRPDTIKRRANSNACSPSQERKMDSRCLFHPCTKWKSVFRIRGQLRGRAAKREKTNLRSFSLFMFNRNQLQKVCSIKRNPLTIFMLHNFRRGKYVRRPHLSSCCQFGNRQSVGAASIRNKIHDSVSLSYGKSKYNQKGLSLCIQPTTLIRNADHSKAVFYARLSF